VRSTSVHNIIKEFTYGNPPAQVWDSRKRGSAW
jgi:hypothetical protein